MLVTSFYVVSFTFAEVFAAQLIGMFSSDPKLLSIGVPGMRISYVGLILFGLPIVTNSALQGLGKAKLSLILSLLRQGLFLYIPLLTLPHYFGIWGVWMSFPAGDILGGILSYFFLRHVMKWLKTPEAKVVV